jgi:carboxypeptidase family protein/cupin domain
MNSRWKTGVAIALCAGVAATAAAQGRGRGTSGTAAPKAAAKATSIRLTVHDANGGSLDGARISLTGAATGDYTTAGAGMVILPNLADGTYRVRIDREGFVPLEREFTLHAGSPATLDVVLNAAPPPPPPPAPPPPAPKKTVPPSGPPVSVSVVEFLDKNFIPAREPLKESVLACKPLETVRLLQVREGIAAHTHADVDEVVYVVAGEGSARIGEQVVALKPGMMVVVPHASAHAFTHSGKNPLMLLSTLSGAPCEEGVASK